MGRIAIVGGHGQVARHLPPLLVEAGHLPVSLVRSTTHAAELVAVGAEVRILDIELDGEAAFAEVFADCEAVVFAAGAGPNSGVKRKRTVDLEGSLKSIAGARTAGISRFVQVSAIGIDAPVADDSTDVWSAYVEAKRDADTALRASGLAWTIVRPGGLTDEPPTGLVTLAEHVERGQVPRADVAAVVAAALLDDRSIGCQWELVSGSTPVAEAVAAG